jgi:hypothetical protein
MLDLFCVDFSQGCEMKGTFSDLEVLGMFVGCLCHDLDHRGTNNAFQEKYECYTQFVCECEWVCVCNQTPILVVYFNVRVNRVFLGKGLTCLLILWILYLHGVGCRIKLRVRACVCVYVFLQWQESPERQISGQHTYLLNFCCCKCVWNITFSHNITFK